MKTIFTLLQDIEKLIFKILMWVLLLPKTIVQITINPGWAPGYVKGEFEQKDSAPFDEHMSPVILLLVVALIPALAFSFLPTFGTSLSSSAEEKPTTDRFLSFTSQTDFISASRELDFAHLWWVERVNADGSYEEIYGEEHLPEDETSYLEVMDRNTVRDRFLYTFSEPGTYYVNVLAGNVDRRNDDFRIVEEYFSYLTVTVPVRLDEQVAILNTNTRSATPSQAQSIDSFSAQVQKEKTIFLALALMLPPLLFAFASRVLRDEISENTLKEDFYIQCYYFAPPSLAIWATFYALYFFTRDAYFHADESIALQVLLIPPLLAVLWFFRAEVKVISHARNISRLAASLIVLACLAVLVAAAYAIFFFGDLQDNLRLFAIQLYPLGAAGLIVAFGFAWYRRQKADAKPVTLGIASMFAVYAAVFLGVLMLVRNPMLPLGEPGIAIEETQIVGEPPAAINTSTPTSVVQVTPLVTEGQPPPPIVLETPTSAPQPYYTEEFNGDVAGWRRFMSSGDERMVDLKVDLGKLSVNLLQLEDKLPWFYLINDAYTYSDVRVEAVVTNRGVNANGVSLICRYSDIGWYEFMISNSGNYSIFAVDAVGMVSRGYNEIFAGGSSEIKAGPSTNVYAIVCEGGELRLYINQEHVRTIEDIKFKFAEGKIGLAVSSPRRLPVNVDFDSLTVSAP
jgi:nitrate reductase NapE component